MLEIGQHVGDFNLKDAKGNIHTISEHLGKKLVIYFYPKDNTPGCTKQACNFRDNYHHFNNENVVLYGISFDDAKSHERFIQKHDLPFTLLTDDSQEVAKRFGAFGERNVFGRVIGGLIRSTFVIDELGNLEKMWRPASASKNTKEVVDYLNEVK